VKIQFTLDGETGLPSGYNVYEQRESNMSVPPTQYWLLTSIMSPYLPAFVLSVRSCIVHNRTAHGRVMEVQHWKCTL